MLNEHDLSDFPRADNSLGWVVQKYQRGYGWKNIEGPFPLRETAFAVLQMYLSSDDVTEFRVYEALGDV